MKKNEILKGRYKTRQSDFLLDFLRESRDRQLSINDIADALCGSVGKSTVYRRIGEMTEAGMVRRFRGEDGKSVLYQFAGENHECDGHFHLKCVDCGKLIHLDCNRMEALAGHIGEEHGFRLDATKCVLYGECEKCAGGKKQ